MSGEPRSCQAVVSKLGASGIVCQGVHFCPVHLLQRVAFLCICVKEPHSLVVALPGGDCWKGWPVGLVGKGGGHGNV